MNGCLGPLKVAAAFSHGVGVHPMLRWRSKLARAHEGGSRRPWWLYPVLAFVPPPEGTPRRVVLVDDMCTDGGHMQACAAMLSRNGRGYIADYGMCGGRRTAQLADPFSVPQITFEDFVPYNERVRPSP